MVEYIGDIKNLFEKDKDEENHLKPVRNFGCKNHIKYKSNSDRNKGLSVEEYLNKIDPYLKDINNLKKSDVWKSQLTIANNFISFKDNDEDCAIYSKGDKHRNHD